jgi:hypothetical protein
VTLDYGEEPHRATARDAMPLHNGYSEPAPLEPPD